MLVQATVVSPWIVQHEALEPFLCDAPPQDPKPLPYLSRHAHPTLDIHMQAAIRPAGAARAEPTCVSRFRDVYWTFPQMLAHHTLGGCNVRAGDIIASGTVSSPADASEAGSGASNQAGRRKGCLLELTENGKVPVQLEGGAQRSWLQDGDAVEMRAWCEKDGLRIGFGPCDMVLAAAHQA
jgi:fumarylacetoacetase